MLLKKITAVTESGEMIVDRPIQSLLVQTDVEVDSLSTETVTIYVERDGSTNQMLANRMPLKDFILASTFGNSAVHSTATFNAIAICDLAVGGAIDLWPKEKIHVLAEGLIVGKKYDFYGIESYQRSNILYFHELKSIGSEKINDQFALEYYDMAVLTMHASIKDLSYKFSNGETVKFLRTELEAVITDGDPICAVKSTGSILKACTDKLQLNLLMDDVNIIGLEINKDLGTRIDLYARTAKNADELRYQA